MWGCLAAHFAEVLVLRPLSSPVNISYCQWTMLFLYLQPQLLSSAVGFCMLLLGWNKISPQSERIQYRKHMLVYVTWSSVTYCFQRWSMIDVIVSKLKPPLHWITYDTVSFSNITSQHFFQCNYANSSPLSPTLFYFSTPFCFQIIDISLLVFIVCRIHSSCLSLS